MEADKLTLLNHTEEKMIIRCQDNVAKGHGLCNEPMLNSIEIIQVWSLYHIKSILPEKLYDWIYFSN
jgi:hypothetical protein